MPQLVFAALIGAGFYAGYRYASRQLGKDKRSAEAAAERTSRDAANAPRDLGNLERDPVTGVYRPG